MAGGGTSVAEQKSWTWVVAFVIVSPVVAYVVHRMGGTRCSWDYGASGGACRAVILLSLLAGAAAGALAAVAARRGTQERGWLGFAVAAAVVLALGSFAARQFGDYMRGRAGVVEMDDRLCTFARKTLPDCAEVVWDHAKAVTVRRAQPDCYSDAQAIRTYDTCSKLTDCQQVIDCVAKAP